ncbi:uncharacterized protein LOC124896194 [Capsicum annuum]|uniref:uncharacterized protein LOC124896194 n=1 Tax=Capsicum annuum TaxID=4072 RepID=UPI001FB0E06A|nr:uncharacterized protein LOC124896194 [Capsicum annuum]
MNFDHDGIEDYEETVEALISVLKRYKRDIGWTIADIAGIPPSICTNKIQLEEYYVPTTKHQRRLNPPMQEVVNKEIIKYLDAGVVYPISDSKWASECLKGKIVDAPIVFAPDWSKPFEIICNASGVAIEAVLGQKKDKLFHPIYDTSKALNGAQKNYTITEQELLAVVYAFEKF